MGREHFAVGVNVYPFAFSLLEEFIQILEVMTGNQNRFALLCPQGDLRGNRMSVIPRIPGIEQLHGAQVDFAALQNEIDPVLQAQVFAQRGRQALMNKSIDLVVFLPEDLSMVGIGRDSLDSEKQGVLQGEDIAR